MTFTHSRMVYLSDTDAAGVVYFATGLQMCHEAYEASLDSVGISLQQFLAEGKIAIPIVHAAIDFLRPLHCGDKLQINLITTRLKDSEFAIAYQIVSVSEPNKVLVKANTRHVCIDPQARTRIELPDAIAQWLDKI
ncbi:thioesterase family protein [Myxosarcina sp. GI1]|uniref:acyl-CoA thioesterase n=1 Tax=Myxosarcina sp. GI1 TaxID=1541065 RepID=UPI00055DD151|nr:thioesterase family protein [Myxosarcina sp. GI1]